ncbi:transcription intermediary factor 1-alpha isoform X2 [Daktulosphaira vitifoliae]|uniref:transcription intermediary factor 1-alpha isoform X2 n=1 Tax=Daktulosphaira vitifoliae TaxID=58002 RepID=UPI0021AA1948|nr:transcription intermediary factor 1-alpha isoform X2 [Daktulosphaira vitifoliae]
MLYVRNAMKKTRLRLKTVQILKHFSDQSISHSFSVLSENALFCSNHTGEIMNLYCENCSTIICTDCFSTDHNTHTTKKLEDATRITKTNISTMLIDIEKNIKYMKYCLKVIEDDLPNLDRKKDDVKRKIDDLVSNIITVVNDRAQILKTNVDACYTDSVKKAQENKQRISELINQNIYYTKFSNSILDHKNVINILKHRNLILSQLHSIKQIDIIPEVSDLNSKIVFQYENHLQNVIADIKKIGFITTNAKDTIVIQEKLKQALENDISRKNISITDKTPPSSSCPMFPKTDDQVEVHNLYSKTNQIFHSKNNNNKSVGEYSDISDDNAMKECDICCKSFVDSEKFVECSKCLRIYHLNCHLPLPLEKDIQCSISKKWTCTLCIDIEPLASSYIDDDRNKSIFSKIIRRILLELYCQSDDSLHFMECPNIDANSRYYDKIKNPTSLNKIKDCLQSDIPLSIINDIKCIFENAISYYHTSDPLYNSAINLLEYFNSMTSKWLPNYQHIKPN